MAVVKPFRGIRPRPEFAKAVASRPYDVLNSEEAREEAKGNAISFLHVVKPEICLDEGVSLYSPEVYQQGRVEYERLWQEGVLLQDERPCYYIYRLTMDGYSQTGWVGCTAVEDYFNGVVLKHELTRPDKEEDRKNHIRVSRIHAEPVFYAYPPQRELDELLAEITQGPAGVDFEAEDGIRHETWVVDDSERVAQVENLFASIEHTYVADGHHRTAAGALVGREWAKANPNHQGNEEYNFFLAVHFPANHLRIFDYNRVVKDLNRLSVEGFLEKLQNHFTVEQMKDAYRPETLHTFGCYIAGKWYRLTAKEGSWKKGDPIGELDVTILSEKVLDEILGISDLRRDKRIDFVGGMRGLGELQRRVDIGEMAVAFALYPVSMAELFAIADAGKIMPPKTTWFEPKLRSGLVIHALE